MKPVKRYTAIQVDTNIVNEEVIITLTYGRIGGPYYDRTHPTEIFNTEEEAIKYAYDTDNYAKWLILPIIQFNNN